MTIPNAYILSQSSKFYFYEFCNNINNKHGLKRWYIMIKRVGQDVNFKLIKDSAYKTVAILRKNAKSAEADRAYKQFLSEGIKAPGYAETIMKLAKNDASLNDMREMLDYKISPEEFEKRSEKLVNGFLNLFAKNSEMKFKFDKAGKEMYPRTWYLRGNILNWWRDTSEHKYKTSQFKELKRDFWGTMEKVNPKIAEIRSKYKN